MRTHLAVLLIVVSILTASTLDHLTRSSRAVAKTQNSLTQNGISARQTLRADHSSSISTIGPVGPVATSIFSSAAQGRVPGTDETFARLITKSQSEGPVRVIVGLKTAFQPEGFLSNGRLVAFQRKGIARDQARLVAQLEPFDARSITRFSFIPFMAMELDAAGLAFLRNSPEVSSIEEDLPRPLALAESVPLIGGPAAWAGGFTGAGQTVAILDTGVDKTHSFLAGKVVSEACYSTTNFLFTSVCPGGVSESTNEGSGVNCSINQECIHGTHVAGIAAGKGSSFSGVAKDANIISIQVASQPSSGGIHLNIFDSNMISGLQRVQQLSSSFSIAAVNMSFGGGNNQSNCDSANVAIKTAIDNLRSIGIATVISSGNDGFTNAISSPACISSAVSVGSTEDGSGGTVVNRISSFSNSASFLNLLAPGEPIFSSVPGGGFQNLSGTSMAAPHVTGAWAVLKSKAPSATVDQVLQALTSTGVPITDTRNGITKPRIKVDAALNALPLSHVLTIASSNPASDVSITVSPNDNSNLGSGATQFTRTYNQNTSVTLTAPATVGINSFQKWQRDGVDFATTASTSVTMDADHTMTAIYITPTRTLTVASSNPASGVSINVSPNDNSNLGSGGTPFTRTYNQNQNVTLTAPATVGINTFQKWQRDGVDFATTASTSVTMDADHTITAIYIMPTRTLTISSSNPNSGVSITVSPNDNSNLGTGATPFSRTYNQNTIVTLTAPATAGGQTFYKWQRNGVDFSINPNINLTMNSDYTMTAVYGTRTLTISSNPNSGVSITVSPNDTNNLGNGTTGFSRAYNVNTIVTLTTPPTAGANIFQKWQRNGADWSTNQSTSVTMDSDYNLMAVYVSPPASVQTLTVAAAAPPDSPTAISITVSPNDNNNLGNGTTPFGRSYNHNTTVTLTAPALTNTFRKWQRNGLDWSTSLTTSVTMDANYTMTAVYGPPFAMRTLNVASSNPNNGVNVNLFPNDVNNHGGGTTQYSRTYNPNATVTLAAPATAGLNTFQKWQRNGVDFSTNPIIDVTLDLFTVNMTAVYVSPPTQTLTVGSANPDSGVSITVSPNDNSNLGGGTTQFSRTYNPNTNVTLTAPATAGGNNFQKWQRNGVDWSTSRTTSVVIDANHTLTAVYVAGGSATTLVASPASVGPAGALNVSWTAPVNHSGSDWVGLFRTDAPNTTWVDYKYVPAGGSGSLSFTAPATPGSYEFRYLLDNGFTSTATSNSFTVDAGGGNYSLAASPSAQPGATITVNWTAPGGHSTTDWIGLYRSGTPDTAFISYQYLTAATAATFSFVAPQTEGTYEFRLYPNNGFTRAATSNQVAVSNAVVLDVNVTNVGPGGTVTVNWSSSTTHAANDWIGLYLQGAPDANFISFQYIGTAGTSGSRTFTMPNQNGVYEFRYFLNDTYAKAATSTSITLSGGSNGLP